MNWNYIIASYLIIGAFFAGKDYHDSRNVNAAWWRHVILFMLLLIFTPILYIYQGILDLGKKIILKTEEYFHVNFYIEYWEGEYDNIHRKKLIDYDMMCFRREFNKMNDFKSRHFIHVAKLIFSKNNYNRKKWKVVDGRIEEVKPKIKRGDTVYKHNEGERLTVLYVSRRGVVRTINSNGEVNHIHRDWLDKH